MDSSVQQCQFRISGQRACVGSVQVKSSGSTERKTESQWRSRSPAQATSSQTTLQPHEPTQPFPSVTSSPDRTTPVSRASNPTTHIRGVHPVDKSPNQHGLSIDWRLRISRSLIRGFRRMGSRILRCGFMERMRARRWRLLLRLRRSFCREYRKRIGRRSLRGTLKRTTSSVLGRIRSSTSIQVRPASANLVQVSC